MLFSSGATSDALIRIAQGLCGGGGSHQKSPDWIDKTTADSLRRDNY